VMEWEGKGAWRMSQVCSLAKLKLCVYGLSTMEKLREVGSPWVSKGPQQLKEKWARVNIWVVDAVYHLVVVDVGSVGCRVAWRIGLYSPLL